MGWVQVSIDSWEGNNLIAPATVPAAMKQKRKQLMNQNKILLFGALIGAATGLAAALILQRRAEKTGTEISLSTGEGIQLGVMIMGLLRAISSLGDEK